MDRVSCLSCQGLWALLFPGQAATDPGPQLQEESGLVERGGEVQGSGGRASLDGSDPGCQKE